MGTRRRSSAHPSRVAVTPDARVSHPVAGFRLEGDAYRHAIRVLRLRVGDELPISDGLTGVLLCRLEEVTRTWAFARLLEGKADEIEPAVQLILGCGLLKGDKMDWVLQKGTELGVARFVLFEGMRSVRKRGAGEDPSRSGETATFQRWQRILAGAAAQCGRGKCPDLVGPLRYPEALAVMQGAKLSLMLYEGAQGDTLLKIVTAAGPSQTVACLIGPEGGFDPAEVEAAEAAGFCCVTLGKRILRAETAAVVVPALVLAALDEVG